jgi:hypothetical protein
MAAKREATAVGLGEGRQMNAANVKEGNIHPMSLSSSGKSEQEEDNNNNKKIFIRAIDNWNKGDLDAYTYRCMILRWSCMEFLGLSLV